MIPNRSDKQFEPNTTNPLPSVASLVGDAIQIGRRFFHIVPVPGSNAGSKEILLKKAVEELSKCEPADFDTACKKIEDLSYEPNVAIKVQFTTKGTIVNRLEGGGMPVALSSAAISPRGKPLFELHEVPPPIVHNKEYWIKSLSSLLKEKNYSKDTVDKALDSIFNEGRILLVDIMEGKEASEWGEKTISDLLQEPGNEELRSALLSLTKSYNTRSSKTNRDFKKCYSDILIYILKNIQRTPRIIPLDNGGQMRQQFVQGNKHLHQKIAQEKLISAEDIGRRGKGFPSEADKEPYRQDIVHNNTNLGSVTTFKSDNTPERMVTTRSGKSDTFERLQEHVLEACVQQLSCALPRGLTCSSPGVYEFQHAITTYLDPSRTKAIGETLNTGSGERQYLDMILREVNKWPDGGIKINLIDSSGQLIEVTLKKPIICNQLFSSTVRGVTIGNVRVATMGQEQSDLINLVANTQLLSLYHTNLPAPLQVAKEAFEQLLQESGDLLANTTVLQSPVTKNYMREICAFLLSDMKASPDPLLARALFTLFFRQAPSSEEYLTYNLIPTANQELHVADMEIMRNIVLDKLGISKGKQCKSGTDRTAIGVALACAQEKFEDTFALTYDPTSAKTSRKEHLIFKSYFREALKEMGVSIVCETKGYSGLKWGGGVPIMGGIANPSAYKYLYLNEDVVPLKDYGIADISKPDVEGLTYADLKTKGTRQYRGSLRDARALHGKSSKKFASQLAESQKVLSQAQGLKEKIVQRVNAFFHENLRLTQKQIIGESLELIVHVRTLQLNEPIGANSTKTRLDLIEERIEALKASSPSQNRAPNVNSSNVQTPNIRSSNVRSSNIRSSVRFQDMNSLETNAELYILQQITSLWQLIQKADKIAVIKDAPFVVQISPIIGPPSQEIGKGEVWVM